MDTKTFNPKLCVVAFICIISSTLIYFYSNITSWLETLSLPIEIVAGLLRWMSLSSGVGNFFACILYVAISLIPIGYLVIKLKNEYKDSNTFSFRPEYTLLIVLAGVLLYMIYAFINPGILTNNINEIMSLDNSVLPFVKGCMSLVGYSLLLGYLIIRFVINFNNYDIWSQTENLLKTFVYVYVAFVCITFPVNMFLNLENKSVADIDSMITIFNYILEILPIICFVTIVQSGILIVNILKKDRHDAEAAEVAVLMASRSRITVIVSVGCNVLKNITQLIMSRHLSNTNFLLDIPFLPLILAFVGLMIAEHLKDSAKIYDENQSII